MIQGYVNKSTLEGHWNGQVVRDQVHELESKTLKGFKIKFIFFS